MPGLGKQLARVKNVVWVKHPLDGFHQGKRCCIDLLANIGAFLAADAVLARQRAVKFYHQIEYLGQAFLCPFHFTAIVRVHQQIDVYIAVAGMAKINIGNLISATQLHQSIQKFGQCSNRHDHIKRVLDNGGHGVVVPMVNTRREAADAVSACLYPPTGTRSVGGSVHALNWNATPTDYYLKANQEILIVLQCEHIDPVKNFDEVYSVPGIDAVFVGPNDLAHSMGYENRWDEAPVQAAIEQTLKSVVAQGKCPGILALTAADEEKYADWGARYFANVATGIITKALKDAAQGGQAKSGY